MDRGDWQASVHGVAKPDRTERVTLPLTSRVDEYVRESFRDMILKNELDLEPADYARNQRRTSV